jgi:hypothetical protein
MVDKYLAESATLLLGEVDYKTAYNHLGTPESDPLYSLAWVRDSREFYLVMGAC